MSTSFVKSIPRQYISAFKQVLALITLRHKEFSEIHPIPDETSRRPYWGRMVRNWLCAGRAVYLDEDGYAFFYTNLSCGHGLLHRLD